MTFHQGSNLAKKKGGLAYRRKQGNSFSVHQAAVAAAEAARAEAGLDDPNPAAEPDPAKSPPVKKQRSDNNWRVSRAVQSLERKAEKTKTKVQSLERKVQKSNTRIDAVVLEGTRVSKGNAALTATVKQQKLRLRDWSTKSLLMRRRTGLLT